MGFMDTLTGWFGKAKESASDLSEKAKPMVDKTKDVAGDAWDKTKEVAGDVGEKAKPVVDKTKDVAGDAWDKTKGVAGDVSERAKDMVDGDDGGGDGGQASE